MTISDFLEQKSYKKNTLQNIVNLANEFCLMQPHNGTHAIPGFPSDLLFIVFLAYLYILLLTALWKTSITANSSALK